MPNNFVVIKKVMVNRINSLLTFQYKRIELTNKARKNSYCQSFFPFYKVEF